MPQRSEQFYSTLGKRSILQLALDVHMTTTGAFERNPADQEKDVEALREVASTWEASRLEFDRLVLSLVMTTLDEWEDKQ
jgi:hypothetical protein